MTIMKLSKKCRVVDIPNESRCNAKFQGQFHGTKFRRTKFPKFREKGRYVALLLNGTHLLRYHVVNVVP